MRRLSRPAVFALVGVLAIACSACKSNNEGKIVGKWKASSADTGAPAGIDVIYEFTADGRFSISALGSSISGKYSLGSGDTVNMTEINPLIEGKTKSREKISVDGDVMTLDGEGGKKMKLTRVK